MLIGTQLRPILERPHAGGACNESLGVAALLLAVTNAARFAWVMSYNAVVRWRYVRGKSLPVPLPSRPRIGSGLVVSWAGMRSILTLAAAFAVPEALPDGSPFPHRDLILLCAFAMGLCTLVLQGLTIKLLIRAVSLVDVDPVGREIRLGCSEVYRSLLDAIKDEDSLTAKAATQGIRARDRAEQPAGGFRYGRCRGC